MSFIIKLLLSISLLNSLIHYTNADELLEVLQPIELKNQFNGPSGVGTIRETPALFGIPSYRSVRTGILIYTPENHLGCEPFDPDLNPDWKNAMKSSASSSVVLLVDRGNCTFVTKVRNAEYSDGRVVSVIFVDTQGDEFLPYISDQQGNGQRLTVPSMLISYEDGEKFKKHLREKPGTKIIVALSYSLPRPDNRVEYEIWSTSYDYQSRPWKTAFGEVARALGTHAQFTPHYYIMPGSVWGCDQPDQACKTQCTNHGRYCSTDPEKDITVGYDGRDIVTENLRQLCLFRLLNNTSQELEFWRYWETFYSSDKGCSTYQQWKTSDCSYNIIDSLNFNGVKSKDVQQCIVSSGNILPDTDAPNTILDEEIQAQEKKGIFTLPQAFVNDQPYYGSLSCPPPIDLDHCGIFQQICAGYQDGTQPQACRQEVDCKIGQKKDVCGICDGDGKSCLGCDGVPFGKKLDPCGVCGGNGSVDKCGQCLPKDSPQRVDDEDQECPKSSSAFSIGALIATVVVLALVVGVSVYYYMKKQNNKMRDDIDSLLRQYLPLEGGAGTSSSYNHSSSKYDRDDQRLLGSRDEI